MILRLATHAMGTRFELVLDAAERVRGRAAGEAALAEIEDWDRRLSLFRRDSLLAHVNREAARGPVRLDRDCYELLEACAAAWRASGGAFDPSVAPRMRALGLHGERSSAPAGGIAGFGSVELDPGRWTVRFTRPGTALDLGAIGKGQALDRAGERLREAGIGRALLHGGTSSVLAIGAPAGREAWLVALEGGEAVPLAALRDSALSVSAQHGRTLPDGRGHVLDPASGEPVAGGELAAVIAPSARLAEAWSTALLVRGSLPPGAPALEALLGSGAPRARAWRAAGPLGAFRISAPLSA